MALSWRDASPPPPGSDATPGERRRGLVRGGRMPRGRRADGWDGRAAFAELGLSSIAVSFCSSLVAETVRIIQVRTSPIPVPKLPAALN
eukprot:627070-Hanusia_phi.AAC.1